jgi:hypothetical protein
VLRFATSTGTSGHAAFGALRKQGSISFLKKRNKKLLSVACRIRAQWGASMMPETDKSFLVLFFKKELLSLPSPLRYFASLTERF